MTCDVSAFWGDCGPVFAQIYHPEREDWGRNPWVCYCERCLNMYLDGCDAGLYREPKALQFRAVLS